VEPELATVQHRHHCRQEGRLQAAHHCRHACYSFANVYINMVFIDIFVNTPHNIVHMMDTKLRRPLTVQLQGTTPVLTASNG
jgi:hypothetical protein